MKLRSILTGITCAAVLGACASAPTRIEQLEQARADVQSLAQDPLAQQAASRELAAARNALQQAETALEQKRPREEIVHLAYVAGRHAEIGKARIAEATARRQIAQGQAERNRVLLEAREREAQLAQQRAQQAQQQAEVARQDALSARAELEDMQKQFSELQAKQTERGMVLTLSDVLFDTGQATLKPGADLALDRVAEFLRENAGTRVIVEGHTDSRGSEEYNLRLSERRAQSVADALRMRGIEPGRFQVVGRGEGYPVANNATAEGRQQNRRVEIVFSDNAGRFAQGPTEDEATLR